MIEPNTGNEHLDRMLVWYRLISEIGINPSCRSEEAKKIYGDGVLNMTIVTNGTVDPRGHFCVSAACAVGTAALHPYFNARGLKPSLTYDRRKLSSLEVKLDGLDVVYIYEKLSEFFGLRHEDYLSIVQPEAYSVCNVTAVDVLWRMTTVIDRTFGVDPMSHPFIKKTAA